ncbi:glycosyltransferase family 2 protein [Lentisphaerota bacterium ZTH]|nr:glycosyltransferase family 2 protein [Lentisphaerota bacterium]WET07035.1 glycosyltransferase family 2 protein [Lentisphaerota bacterium ZTH]
MDISEKKRKVSVVFSFYNEENAIPVLSERTSAVLDAEIESSRISDYEVIFVNDASQDSSLEILAALSKENPRIKLINMSRNFGVAPCVLAGFQYASGDAVIYLDADLQDPPELISQLISKWLEGCDVVHTVRLKRHGESLLKLQITRVGYYILDKFTKINLPVQAGDFKLLSRKVVKEVLKMNEYNPFTRGLIAWCGFKEGYVYYERAPRAAGKTKFPVISFPVISNFLNSALLSYTVAPLYFALFAGFIVSMFSFLFLIYALIQKFLIPTTSGWTAIVSLISLLGGVQLICTGVLGLYLGTIFMETKKRPRFIVKETVNFDD